MNPDWLPTHSLRVHPQGRVLAEIMAAMLEAVHPTAAVRRNLRRDGGAIVVGDRRYERGSRARRVVVGVGKAAVPMAQAAYEVLGDWITAGLLNAECPSVLV